MDETLLSREDPFEEEAALEFSTFTAEEREVFFGCRALLLEQGSEPRQAERDAAAAIVEQRRLQYPSLSGRDLQQAERFYTALRHTMGEEAAEREAVARVLAIRRRRSH